MRTFWTDLRFAFRKIRQSPTFTLIAVITLALGIGLNTAIFSLINDLFLRGLPFKEPSRVVHLYGGDKSRDLRSIRVAEAPIMEFYRPLAQENFPFVNVTVRTSLKLDAATKAVQSALRKVNPSLAIAMPQMMDAVVAQALGQARLMTWLLGIFAGVALLLASIGIYGAVAYSVEQRTGEIGVRMALGAQTRDVLRLVVNQGMKPVVIGLAIGIVSAFVLARLLTTQLYEVSAHNPALLAGSTVLLAAIALIACVVPARRAAHVDPMVALHYE